MSVFPTDPRGLQAVVLYPGTSESDYIAADLLEAVRWLLKR